MNYSMMELVWLLLIYSFLGWVVETIVGTVKKKKFVNRGFSTGPFCLVYGIAAVFMAVTMEELMAEPVFQLIGCGLGASWKNFDLSTFWQGVGGIYRYSWETSTDIRGNLTSRWVNRYSADNINAPMPALGNTMNDSYSSFWLEKSDYLRLKNLEFGYTFRQAELAKVGISSIRVYFAGSNLLTFTPLKNWDPEKSSGDTRNDVHPNMRTYSFGLNIQF